MGIKLTPEVKDSVRRIWPKNKAHAAKQIVCWLNAGVLRHDLDAQVNYAVEVGMIAERAKSIGANAFIAEVEDRLGPY